MGLQTGKQGGYDRAVHEHDAHVCNGRATAQPPWARVFFASRAVVPAAASQFGISRVREARSLESETVRDR